MSLLLKRNDLLSLKAVNWWTYLDTRDLLQPQIQVESERSLCDLSVLCFRIADWDINNDGYADLTVFPFTQSWNDLRLEEAGKPIFYINDQRGSLVNLNISMLPGHSSGGEGGLQSTISDVNQDGHIDVILFGLTAADNTDDIEILLLRDDLPVC